MNRIVTASAVAILALSAMPNASQAAHSKRHHHKHHHAAAVTTRADDCFLTRMFKRVADVVRCRV